MCLNDIMYGSRNLFTSGGSCDTVGQIGLGQRIAPPGAHLQPANVIWVLSAILTAGSETCLLFLWSCVMYHPITEARDVTKCESTIF